MKRGWARLSLVFCGLTSVRENTIPIHWKPISGWMHMHETRFVRRPGLDLGARGLGGPFGGETKRGREDGGVETEAPNGLG